MSHQYQSSTERLATILFIITAASLVWIVQSHAHKSRESQTEDSFSTQQPSKRKERKCPNCSPPGNQEIYIPLIDLPEARGSEIVFNSRSPQTMNVTPVFYKRNGEVVIADPVQVNSAEIRYVDIKSLLPERYRKQRDWGGFALTYYGTNREMWSQFRFLGVNGGQNIDEFFTVKEESRADRYEATWWMPDKSEAIVALGNISDAYTNATVIFGNGHTRMVSLQPHATEFVRDEQRDGGGQSVTINVNGAAGSIVPTGLISAKDGSFNSVIRFYAPHAAKQSNLYANGFRVKGVTPYMTLKNTASNSLAVVPTFTPLDGTASLTLPRVVLAAGETREVDLSRLARASQRRSDLDVVSVEVTNPAAPGSIIGALYSRDNETGTVYDTPLRDSGLVRSMTGSYPWKIDNDFTTIAYVTNISDQKAGFVGEINYQGGHVLLEPRKLNPHETAVFDLRDFRDNQKSDSTGNKLPADVSLGQFKWTVKGITNGKLLLVGRAEIVSRSERVSSSYSCNDPCPPYLQGDLNPFPPPIVFVSGTATSSAWETAIYSSGYNYTWAASANWSADNSAVSIDPSAAHTTNLTGEQPGDSCITADMGREESYGWDGLNCYDNNNSYPVASEGCLATATLHASVVSPTVTADGDAVTAGERFSLRVEVRLANGSRAPLDGDAAFNVENTTGNDETIPGGITLVNGAGSADVTLLRVPDNGVYGRGYNVTFTQGNPATFHGHFQIWFRVIASDEGLETHTTACGNVIAHNDHFVALPATGLCNTTVQLVSGGNAVATTVKDVGPFYPDPIANPCAGPSDRYWLTTGVPRAESDSCSSGAGIDLADGTFFQDLGLSGNTRILWRFGN